MSKYKGNVRVRFDTDTDISFSEKLRRGIKYSSPPKPSTETLDFELLRDDVLVARIIRATKRIRENQK